MKTAAVTLFIWALVLALATNCIAAEPPKDPILRIETGMHTAKLNRIATDASGRWLVTASDDKSLRVWEHPSGRLVRTIRPPIGEVNEGKLSAVALSPDGSTIACGGWTWFNNGSNEIAAEGATIYLFNRASGNLITRITGLPNVIFHLAFSPDGRFLAVSLGVNNGIRLYRTSDWLQTGEDKEYGSDSYSAHFSRNDKLVTTSFDGYLRLYDVSRGKLDRVAKEKAPGGKQPYSARFSPDGSKVAVGYEDTAAVSVHDAKDLDHLFSPDISGLKGIMNAVEWSIDGHYLYAGGRWSRPSDGVWEGLTRRWSDGGKGSSNDAPATTDLITDMVPLADGQIAFVSGAPSFGVLGKDGMRKLFVPPAISTYRENFDGFRVSKDGSSIAFAYAYGGQLPATFDLASRNIKPGISTSLHSPIDFAIGLEVTNWKHYFSPKLNGSLIQLDSYEISRSLAIAHDANSFILGTGWNLRRFSRSGAQLWRVAVPGTVWGVNIAANDSVLVAAYGDGTIRWHRMTDGKELLAFFPHADRKRWVLWTPSGYYDASPGGEELIGWHVNNGKDQAADFFPADKFRSAKYRPDVIAKVLDTLDEGEAVRMANAESGRKQTSASVAQLLPPVVSITGPQDGAKVSDNIVTIRYTIRSPEDAPATSVRVLVDGRPVATERGVKVVPKDSAEQRVTVAIPERDCEVSVIAENRHSTSVPATVRLTWAGKKQEEFTVQPKLYVLAVGVSAYRDKGLTLKYAAKDARDFAAAVEKQKGGMYRDVVTKILADETATKEDIMDGLDWLQKEVTARDIGIIFIAGHGVNDPTGNYFYLPQNADTEKLKRTGVAFNDIKSTLASLAGKAVLFVDTCHSGNVMGTRRGVADINAVVNELASSENGAVVFASSTGKQYSLEDDKWGNGAFTKALVEGLSGKADYSGKGKITINMLDLYLSERVKELTKGQQTPTTTKPQTIQDFPLAVKR